MECVEEENMAGIGSQNLAVLRALENSAANEHDAVCRVWFFRSFRLDGRPALEIDEGYSHRFIENPSHMRRGAFLGPGATHKLAIDNPLRLSAQLRAEVLAAQHFASRIPSKTLTLALGRGTQKLDSPPRHIHSNQIAPQEVTSGLRKKTLGLLPQGETI